VSRWRQDIMIEEYRESIAREARRQHAQVQHEAGDYLRILRAQLQADDRDTVTCRECHRVHRASDCNNWNCPRCGGAIE
jgi:rubrerythrin